MQGLPQDTGMESQGPPETYRDDLWVTWERLSGPSRRTDVRDCELAQLAGASLVLSSAAVTDHQSPIFILHWAQDSQHPGVTSGESLAITSCAPPTLPLLLCSHWLL